MSDLDAAFPLYKSEYPLKCFHRNVKCKSKTSPYKKRKYVAEQRIHSGQNGFEIHKRHKKSNGSNRQYHILFKSKTSFIFHGVTNLSFLLCSFYYITFFCKWQLILYFYIYLLTRSFLADIMLP